ncbi:hypothetical protein PG991_003502 [Apiospora marii]|uniref:Uncharacterized protein n=1 Tax=Apiospora marii TaxID=335849 RepID=A0ABR1S413_9PEZI
MQLLSILSLASSAAALSLPSSPLLKRDQASSPNQARTVANILAADGQTLELDESVVNSAAYEPFKASARVLAKSDTQQAASRRAEQEPDPSRPATTPEYVFVLQCTENGFRGDCLVFGAAPGKCVSYFDFNSGNSTEISDAYNDKIVSLSTNTGGNYQFYKYKGCNNKGDDRGLSSSYNFDLSVSLPSDPRTVEYYKEITSWRC